MEGLIQRERDGIRGGLMLSPHFFAGFRIKREVLAGSHLLLGFAAGMNNKPFGRGNSLPKGPGPWNFRRPAFSKGDPGAMSNASLPTRKSNISRFLLFLSKPLGGRFKQFKALENAKRLLERGT